MPSFKMVVDDRVATKMRLDKYVSSLPDGMNRSKLKSGLTALFLNGKPAKLSSKVARGDEIVLEWEDSLPTDIAPEPIPLAILYEDNQVTVVNKKQGMVTHPAAGNWSGTLVNALLFHWARQAIALGEEKSIRPGIVHRLDKDTSGVIITAKNEYAEDWLHRQFTTRKKLSKLYIAICTGVPKEAAGTIETQIIRDPSDRKRFKAVTGAGRGKYACTHYKVIAVYGSYSLFVLRLKTGRTHQIRVHLKHIGCPILGDPIYGRKTAGTPFAGATLMLHAYILKICLPGASEPTVFKAPVPTRFRVVMKKLHQMYDKVDLTAVRSRL